MAKLHPMLDPFKPTETDKWDRLKAAHLLNRATFGGTPEEIDQVVAQGMDRTIDLLLDFPDAQADELSKTDVPDLSQIAEYPSSFEERRKLIAGKTPEERMLIQQRMNQANQQAVRATGEWWMRRMMSGPYPLHEKLTFFWHGHFTTSARDERAANLMWQQNELLRRHAAGNFEKFVKAISRDPAMLDYLNNQQNRKRHPNENYARELMELFTLGIGNYTENDIKEAARAFTGWGHDGESYVFHRFDHDTDDKVFMNLRGNFDGDDVINIILRHKACAPYIAGKFWKYFVNDSPDPQIVQSLGDQLRQNNWELRPLIRTMFSSKAFYSPHNIGAQIKGPVQLVVGTVRQLDVEMPDMMRLHGALEQMGQVPLAPPNVKGWPGGHLWINTSTLFTRYNTCLWLAGGSSLKSGRKVIDKVNERRKTRFDPSADGDAKQIVDAWLDRLIQRPIAEERRSILLDTVGMRPTAESVKNMISLILSMPEYQLC